MRAQYEEKTFESYFNSELSSRKIFYFPPGQVQEGSMGADTVAFTKSRSLWRRLGYPYWFNLPFQGAPYREMAEEMERHLSREIADVPDIKGNIFFQYKRSEYMMKASAEEWKHWNKPYFRYEIYPEQQALLEHLHSKFSKRVLILYAAPAIQDVSELVDLHVRQQLISRTNFRPAYELAGHKRNTFVNPGAHSWACSEPVRLDPFSFEDTLNGFRQVKADKQSMITKLAKDVEDVLLETSFAQPFELLRSRYGLENLESVAPLLKAYVTMSAVRQVTGLQWVVTHASEA